MVIYIYFEGGSRNGKTQVYGSRLDPDERYIRGDIFFKEERYFRTDEVQRVGGLDHVVFRIAPD